MPGPGAPTGPRVSYLHVLVPIDGSSLADRALVAGRALAARFDAELHTVSVTTDEDEQAALRQHAAEALDIDAADDHVHVELGRDPAAAIHRRADELGSCVVCMSSHGRGRVAGALVGSVARAVLEASRAPIVAVGPSVDAGAPPGAAPAATMAADHLVACVDGGTASETVVPVAAAWAAALAMSLTVVTVAEPSPPPVRPGATWHRRHGPDADADAYARDLAARWRDTAPDLRAEVVYDPISPADGMETYLRAHPTGLVAVTTHARTGLGRVVFGSGAASILRVSSAPVLVVPLLD